MGTDGLCIIPTSLHTVFTYNADSSSTLYRFMITFVHLTEELDGFLPALCGEYRQCCQTVMDPVVGGVQFGNSVSMRERDRDHEHG